MKGKGNDGVGNNINRDSWRTNSDLWNTLNDQYNFGFDCCASLEDKKTDSFSDDFEKIKNISCVAWMNPPFSNSKKMFEHFFKVVKKGVAIYRCDNMETKIWQEIILRNADWIFIPEGRISYTPFEVGNMRNGKGVRFPSALIGIGVDIPKNIKGIILYIKN